MKVVNEDYYPRLDRYISEHISLSLTPDYHGGKSSYITTENKTEYRAIFKLRRLLSYSMYQMLKSNDVYYGFKWEKIP